MFEWLCKEPVRTADGTILSCCILYRYIFCEACLYSLYFSNNNKKEPVRTSYECVEQFEDKKKMAFCITCSHFSELYLI